MRKAFVETLCALAERDPRILLLTGDLGYMALEPFAERFPSRFFNVGVAEQNMIGLATGLAEAGFVPYAYSIATFATLRPYEFIRNGPVLHALPVRVVGMGGGFEYGTNGPTHFALEDVGVMRVQPGLSVFAPADARQTRSVLEKTAALAGPVYYRLGKDDKSVVPGLDGRFEPGQIQLVRDRKREGTLLVLAMGSVALQAEHAVSELEREGIAASFGVVAAVSPPPRESLEALLQLHGAVVTVEAHYADGGLGSLVAESIAERGLACRLARCAVRRLPEGVCGSQAHLLETFGLSPRAIRERAARLLGERS